MHALFSAISGNRDCRDGKGGGMLRHVIRARHTSTLIDTRIAGGFGLRA